MLLYHGSDHIIDKPLFGLGKEDNDYGSGFYTTESKEKADEWASTNGTDIAVTNKYDINERDLNKLFLDDYGQLAWIAEIIAHRGARGIEAKITGDKIIEKYKIDTSKADIIIGYRADDSYIDIVDAFLKNQLSLDEVDRLFRKGNLGQQVFIKSEKAFNSLTFLGYEYVQNNITNENEIRARMEVSKFLRNRATQIQLNGFVPYGITARECIENNYVFNKNYNYYEVEKKGNEDVDEENDEYNR